MNTQIHLNSADGIYSTRVIGMIWMAKFLYVQTRSNWYQFLIFQVDIHVYVMCGVSACWCGRCFLVGPHRTLAWTIILLGRKSMKVRLLYYAAVNWVCRKRCIVGNVVLQKHSSVDKKDTFVYLPICVWLFSQFITDLGPISWMTHELITEISWEIFLINSLAPGRFEKKNR